MANVSILAAQLQERLVLLDAQQDSMTDTVTTVFLLQCTLFVFTMQIGFTLLEAGSVRRKNLVNITMKNFADIATSAAAWFICGYGFAFGDGNSFIGYANFFYMDFSGDGFDFAYAFFQMSFAVTACTLVSGAIAGRCRYPNYMFFSFIMVALVYPPVAHWVWSKQGFLKSLGHQGSVDLAGGGVVHLLGAVVALVGAVKLGPRLPDEEEESGDIAQMESGGSLPAVNANYVVPISESVSLPSTSQDGHSAAAAGAAGAAGAAARAGGGRGGTVTPLSASHMNDALVRDLSGRNHANMASLAAFPRGLLGPITPALPGHSPHYVVLGTMFLFIGWLAFSFGSVVTVAGGLAGVASRVAMTSVTATAAGILMGIVWGTLTGHVGQYDVSHTCNGALAALVAITPVSHVVTVGASLALGVLGSSAAFLGVPVMRRLGVDDPVSAVAVHGWSSIVGLLSAGFLANPDYVREFYRAGTTSQDGSAAEVDYGLFYGGSGALLAYALAEIGVVVLWGSIAGFVVFSALVKANMRLSERNERLGLDVTEHNLGDLELRNLLENAPEVWQQRIAQVETMMEETDAKTADRNDRRGGRLRRKRVTLVSESFVVCVLGNRCGLASSTCQLLQAVGSKSHKFHLLRIEELLSDKAAPSQRRTVLRALNRPGTTVGVPEHIATPLLRTSMIARLRRKKKRSVAIARTTAGHTSRRSSIGSTASSERRKSWSFAGGSDGDESILSADRRSAAFILEGYPLTISQLRAFDQHVKKIDAFVLLEPPCEAVGVSRDAETGPGTPVWDDGVAAELDAFQIAKTYIAAHKDEADILKVDVQALRSQADAATRSVSDVICEEIVQFIDQRCPEAEK